MYRAMGGLGWSQQETAGMEIWRIARTLGEGADDPLPVMRGARWISHPSEDEPDEPDDAPGPRRRPRKRRVAGRGKSLTDKAVERGKILARRQAERRNPGPPDAG